MATLIRKKMCNSPAGVGETPVSLGLVVAVGCAALLPVAIVFAVFSKPPLNSDRCDGGICGTAAAMPTGRPAGTLTVGIIDDEMGAIEVVGVTDD